MKSAKDDAAFKVAGETESKGMLTASGAFLLGDRVETRPKTVKGVPNDGRGGASELLRFTVVCCLIVLHFCSRSRDAC
jgi:hypothetical protein